jgi:hypothetical protein
MRCEFHAGMASYPRGSVVTSVTPNIMCQFVNYVFYCQLLSVLKCMNLM